jgi:DNA-binding response OmpR family regulator
MQCDTITDISQALHWDTGGGKTHHLKQNKQGAQPVRSLVVDDDSTFLKYMALILNMLEFRDVKTAQKKPEVMKKLAAGPYDLLITDLEMPDMNGFHLSQMIKKETHDTRVIIMTGRHKDECHEMMTSRWVDGWLFKPFGLNELRAMLQWLGLKRIDGPGSPPAASTRD